MSKEQLIAFIAKAQEDLSLREKLTATVDEQDVIPIAKEAGYIISLDDISNYQEKLSEEMSAEELRSAEVVGGYGKREALHAKTMQHEKQVGLNQVYK